ncbi:sensory histidine kinase AtoS [compost metagenome]
MIAVSDAGPGFDNEMLAEFGKPYRSSKDRPGSGLGLFLVVNVLRKLGGTVRPKNGKEGGASVTLQLPLASLSPEGADGI